jgi:hypothetical protein
MPDRLLIDELGAFNLAVIHGLIIKQRPKPMPSHQAEIAGDR